MYSLSLSNFNLDLPASVGRNLCRFKEEVNSFTTANVKVKRNGDWNIYIQFQSIDLNHSFKVTEPSKSFTIEYAINAIIFRCANILDVRDADAKLNLNEAGSTNFPVVYTKSKCQAVSSYH